MKSSTLRRSNLTKERMRMLEELAKNRQQSREQEPTVYVRETQDKEKELNVLWQNFRVSQKEEKSPGIYLTTGFIAGAISMLIVTTLLSFAMQNSDSSFDFASPVTQLKEKAKLTFIPADKAPANTTGATTNATKANESYVVKNGDTLASIIIRFYGSYDLTKVEKIKQANHMDNPNDLQIGQNLVIPMD